MKQIRKKRGLRCRQKRNFKSTTSIDCTSSATLVNFLLHAPLSRLIYGQSLPVNTLRVYF